VKCHSMCNNGTFDAHLTRTSFPSYASSTLPHHELMSISEVLSKLGMGYFKPVLLTPLVVKVSLCKSPIKSLKVVTSI